MRAHFFLNCWNNDYNRMSASLGKHTPFLLRIDLWRIQRKIGYYSEKQTSIHTHSEFVEHRRYKSVVCNKIRDKTRHHKSNLLCVQCVLFYRYFCFHILSHTHTHAHTKLTQAHTTPRRNTEKDFAKCSDLFYFTLSFHLISLLRLFSPHFYFHPFKPSAVKLGGDIERVRFRMKRE